MKDKQSEQTDSQKAEEASALNSQRMDALLKLNQMTESTLQEITDFALEEAVQLTRSRIGYLAFLNEDESVLTMHSWSKSAMAECAIADKPFQYPVKSTGLWGEAVRQRKAIITNDYKIDNPLKKGTPQGHVALKRHMNAPIFDGEKMVLVAGVGNKAEPYDQSDVQQLTLIMEGMWRLLERKRTENVIRLASAYNRSLIEASLDPLVTISPKGEITDVNSATEKVTGFPRNELIGKDFSDYFTEPKKARAGYQQVFREGVVRDYPLEIKHRDGHVTSVLYNASVYRDETGKVIGVFAAARDITERKKIDAMLIENEAKFQEFFETAQVGMFRSRADGSGYIMVNEKFARMFGYTKKEMLEQPSTISWEDLKDRETAMRMLREKGALVDFEADLRKKNGSLFTVIASIRSFPETGIIEGSMVDITERKLAEMALQESETKFRDTIKNLDEGYYCCAMDGLLIEHNLAFNRILGFDIDRDMKGSKLPDFWLNPDDRKEYLKELMAKGVIRNFLINAKKVNGEKVVVMASSHLVKDEKGGVARIVGTFTDYTERKRAEEALRESETRYRNLVENASIGIFRTKLDGSEVLDSNPKLCEILGFTREEFVGQPSAIAWANPERREDMVRQLREKGMVNNYEIDVRTKKGDIRTVLMSIVTYPKLGYLEGGLQDITERKLAEDELKKHKDHLEDLVKGRTAELEVANKELESFAYSVSHDLRAPLRTIDGFSQIIIDEYSDKVDTQGRDYLLRVRAATQRMSQLIDDMLKLSKITRQEVKREKVDLSMLTRKITSGYSSSQPERQAEFVIKSGCIADCDRQLAEIALENLISNSWKYSSKHSSARIEFGATEKGGKVAYFVKDDGAGFDPAYADRLFAPFQRLHAASEFQGNGIGLATVQRIVRKHGGNVWAEGQVEKGATFYFTLD